MAKPQKRTNKRKDPFDKNGGKVIREGLYDGRRPSSDFMVSGHSTGSTGSQMEAMSHQVSIDAGEVPAYPVSDYLNAQAQTGSYDEETNESPDDFEDLGGPALYGPKPSLLSKSPLSEDESRNWKRVTLWSAVGLGGAAALSYFAYRLYNRDN